MRRTWSAWAATTDVSPSSWHLPRFFSETSYGVNEYAIRHSLKIIKTHIKQTPNSCTLMASCYLFLGVGTRNIQLVLLTKLRQSNLPWGKSLLLQKNRVTNLWTVQDMSELDIDECDDISKCDDISECDDILETEITSDREKTVGTNNLSKC